MKSKTYNRKVCEGNIYVTIARNRENKVSSLLISPPSKSNDCGGSTLYALQDLVTFGIRHAENREDIKLILKALSGHHCNACPPTQTGHKSCVDAVAQILREELKDELTKKEESQEKTSDKV